jgi:hypothetical protein
MAGLFYVRPAERGERMEKGEATETRIDLLTIANIQRNPGDCHSDHPTFQ